MSKSKWNVVNPDDMIENTEPIASACTRCSSARSNSPSPGTPAESAAPRISSANSGAFIMPVRNDPSAYRRRPLRATNSRRSTS